MALEAGVLERHCFPYELAKATTKFWSKMHPYVADVPVRKNSTWQLSPKSAYMCDWGLALGRMFHVGLTFSIVVNAGCELSET